MNDTADKRVSLEEMTIKSLEMSQEGLEVLRDTGLKCADLVEVNPSKAADMLKDLFQGLRNFYVFVNDVRAIFQLDGTTIRTGKDNLELAEKDLSDRMDDMLAMVQTNNMNGLVLVLRKQFPSILGRFENLLPVLSRHIEEEYVEPVL